MVQETICRNCRKEGEKLFLKGEKCLSPNCPFTRRAYNPGQRGSNPVRRRISDYGIQLKEKQKVKEIYNVKEKQFRNYFKKAEKSPGIKGEVLLSLLEKRLDNVVFRLGLANSRKEARQEISHAHILVNNKKVNIPSYQVKIGDTISFSPKFLKKEISKNLGERLASYKTQEWLKLDPKKIEGNVVKEPQREDIDQSINENLIVEFYSR